LWLGRYAPHPGGTCGRTTTPACLILINITNITIVMFIIIISSCVGGTSCLTLRQHGGSSSTKIAAAAFREFRSHPQSHGPMRQKGSVLHAERAPG